MHQTKRKWRTFGGKCMGKKFNIMERCTGPKNSTNKIQAWNGAQYVKRHCRGTKNSAKLESPWKRSNSKFLA